MCVAPSERHASVCSIHSSGGTLPTSKRASIPTDSGSRPASSTYPRKRLTASRILSSSGPKGNQPSATRAVLRSPTSALAPIHTGIGRCTGKGLILTLVADDLLSPQQAHYLYLLFDPGTARAEVFAECLVFHSVPADSHPEA